MYPLPRSTSLSAGLVWGVSLEKDHVEDLVEDDHAQENSNAFAVGQRAAADELATAQAAYHQALQPVPHIHVEVLDNEFNETLVGDVGQCEVERLDDHAGHLVALAVQVAGDDVLVQAAAVHDHLGEFELVQLVEPR